MRSKRQMVLRIRSVETEFIREVEGCLTVMWGLVIDADTDEAHLPCNKDSPKLHCFQLTV